MPDIGGLYPQPPQQNGQTNFLSDPARAIGMVGELQRIGIINQQAQALGQQPAATLQGTQISNQTAQIQQQAIAKQAIASAFGTGIAGMQNPTSDDVYNLTAYIARSNPQIAQQYPDLINAASDTVLNNPKGIKYGAGLLLNTTLSPEGASSLVSAPPSASGAQQMEPVTSSNLRGTRAVGTPPGTTESAGVMQADLQRASSFGQDIFPWQQALEKIKALGPGGTAPGSEGRQELESFVYGLAPSLVPADVASKIKNYADLNKYLTQGMQQRAQNLGPHTNEGLSTAVTGSPNVKINDMSVDELVKYQIALRRMEQAQIMNSRNAGPVNYTSAKADFANNQDPRAYAIDMMPPDQVTDLQKNLKGAARARFNNSLRAGLQSGTITPPGQ